MSVFGHGQMRLYLLSLLREGPRHGYDIIRALEERFSGLYSPSAGTVYPRLAKLEEEGLVERSEEGRKALYRLTQAGEAEASAREDEIAELEASLDASALRLAAEMRERVRSGGDDLRSQMAEATARYREEFAEDPRSVWQMTTDNLGEQMSGYASDPSGAWSERSRRGDAPGFDLDGLLGGLTRGNLPDPDTVARAVRRWGFGGSAPDAARDSAPTDGDVTNVTDDSGNAATVPPMPSATGRPTVDSDPDSTSDTHVEEDFAATAPADVDPDAEAVIHVTRSDETTVGATSEPLVVEAVLESDPDEDQQDRSREQGFPSGAQVREILDILKDAGERIHAVLDPPRR